MSLLSCHAGVQPRFQPLQVIMHVVSRVPDPDRLDSVQNLEYLTFTYKLNNMHQNQYTANRSYPIFIALVIQAGGLLSGCVSGCILILNET